MVCHHSCIIGPANVKVGDRITRQVLLGMETDRWSLSLVGACASVQQMQASVVHW